MNHEEAIRTQAAERYLLGEMNEAERDAWEAHFFSCAVCAEELKAGAGFVNAVQDFFASAPARAQTPERKPALPWLSWREFLRPVPAFACAMLLLVGGSATYQNIVTIPRLRQPQIMASVFLTQPRSGESKTIKVPREGRFELQIALPPGSDFTAYEGQIISEPGSGPKRVVATIPISAQQAQAQIDISLYAGTLTPGNYSLIVRRTTRKKGENAEEPRYRFTLEFQD
jgi:hypothetical protein